MTCAAAPPVVLPDPEVNASGSIGQSFLLHPQWLIAGATSRRTQQTGGTMTTGAITLWPRGADGTLR